MERKCPRELRRDEIIKIIDNEECACVREVKHCPKEAVPMCFTYKCNCNKFIFCLKGNECDEELQGIRVNDKVEIEFQRTCENSIKIVIVCGIVKCKKVCGCTGELELEVIATEIIGREYFICHEERPRHDDCCRPKHDDCCRPRMNKCGCRPRMEECKPKMEEYGCKPKMEKCDCRMKEDVGPEPDCGCK